MCSKLGRLRSIGLSPLARGTPRSRAAPERSQRFIPAGAGNTIHRPNAINQIAVYPRWRGEHHGKSATDEAEIGLSPLARGTRDTAQLRRRHHRFIPAGAGNTVQIPQLALGNAVYPRWRGEHQNNAIALINNTGLSPLARGTLGGGKQVFRSLRFIPAGAGNTPSPPVRLALSPVYPRWRGEHRSRFCAPGGHSGLSPLARGTL